ncbi:hypothetical protein [Planotetraspora sp. GP83]|uniref:hypothetical protein n=1 Tax=Planotetraspora sp. GP83 TaxID=3156264 RepID=UPI003512765B
MRLLDVTGPLEGFAGDDLLYVVARKSGLGSTETPHRAFARELRVTPTAYRARFRTTGTAGTAGSPGTTGTTGIRPS